MAVNLQYDIVEWVEIGYAGAVPGTDHVNIDNVVSFADRVVSPDGDMLYPLSMINTFSPSGVHHNHKYWELELILDSNWLVDKTADPPEYWQYYQDVKDEAGVHPAIVCDDCDNWIEWFKVYVREANGTQVTLTYTDGTDADENTLWCIGETSEFSNEVGERHQTTTFKFICLKERERAETAEVYAAGANELAVKYMNINNLTIGGVACTNVLSFKDEYVIQKMPQFMPNTFQGIDMKEDHEWRLLTAVVDSETTIFDAYVDVITANTVIPDFFVELTLADGLGTTERWAYADTESYIINRRPGRVHADVARDTIEYQILTVCDKTITHP